MTKELEEFFIEKAYAVFGDSKHEIIGSLDDGGKIHHFYENHGYECLATYAPDKFEVGFMVISKDDTFDKVKDKLIHHYNSFKERIVTYKDGSSNGVYSRMLNLEYEDTFCGYDYPVLEIVDNHLRSLRRIFIGK